MPMRCEIGGPIADEFGAMFLLVRQFRNTSAASVTTTLYWGNCGWPAIKLSLLILDQDD
jgi:hypothetical protein